MGQCLSQQKAVKGQSENAEVNEERVIHNNLDGKSAARTCAPHVEKAKPGNKAPELHTFPTCASDGTSTQPTSAHVTVGKATPQPGVVETSNTNQPNSRQDSANARGRKSSEVQAVSCDEVESKIIGGSVVSAVPPSLFQLLTCVRSPTAAAGSAANDTAESCALKAPQSSVCKADKDPAKEIVINQGGCCSPVTRKDIDLNKVSYDYEALANGLAGLPHDVTQFGAPRPANEEQRMATLRALRSMELGDCSELDLILKVICRIWNAPSACVTLLDSDHVVICSAQGMGPGHRPWAVAMCPWMLLTPHPTAMAIGDLTQDARFSKSLHVAGGTRSYLTSPLVASNGHRLGAICLTDVKPRTFDAGDCRLMNNCAELAMRALEAHLNVAKRVSGRAPTQKKAASMSSGPASRTLSAGGGNACSAAAVLSPPGNAARGVEVAAAAGAGAIQAAAEEAAGEAGEGAAPLSTLHRPLDSEVETDDGTLMEEYRNRVRDIAEVDSSVLFLLDTRVPGWCILYVSPGWEELTRLPREQVMGSTLNEVMAHLNGDPLVVWEGVEREAAAGKAFVTPRVYCIASPSVTFYLSFRPAALGDLDDQAVTLGVPASVPQAASPVTSKLFFARLHTTPDPPPNTRAHTHATHTSHLLATGRRLPPNIAINPVHGLTEVFQGLDVGQVLGQGSYGTVYHARWHGVDVAIKVQDIHIRSATERERAEFEVGLGQRLHHINVVHTFSHASALLERPDNSGPLVSSGSNIWNAGMHLAPLGFILASRATGAEETVGYGSESASPSVANHTLDAGPSFIPFFSSDGAMLLDPSPSPPASAMPVSYIQAVNASPCGKGLPIPVVSGGSGKLVRVALPSGVQVPLLRQTTRTTTTVGNNLPPLSALLHARGSSINRSNANSPVVSTTAAASSGAYGRVAPSVPSVSGMTPRPVIRSVMGRSPSSLLSPSNDPRASSEAGRQRVENSTTSNKINNDANIPAGRLRPEASPFVAPQEGAELGASNKGVGDGGFDYGIGPMSLPGLSLVPFFSSAGGGGGTSPSTGGAAGNSNGSGTGGGGDDDDDVSAAATGPLGPDSIDIATTTDASKNRRSAFGSSVMFSGAGVTRGSLPTGPFNNDPPLTEKAEEDEQQHSLVSPFGGGGAPPGAVEAEAIGADGTAVGIGPLSGVKAAMPYGEAHGAIEADLSGLSYPVDIRLWMVLEFMDKGSLQDAIDRGWLREGRTADHGPDYTAVLATTNEIAAGLVHLHAQEVVHGDLSAVNVLLQSVRYAAGTSNHRARGQEVVHSYGRGFIAKISDFGLSMHLKRPDQAIRTGAYGTITHMAPEVLRDSTLSKAADIYSVGVLFWQMVTGSRPWAGLTHLQVSVEVGTNARQLQWPVWVHGGVRDLGRKLLAPTPSDRPSAAELVQALAGLMSQVPQYG